MEFAGGKSHSLLNRVMDMRTIMNFLKDVGAAVLMIAAAGSGSHPDTIRKVFGDADKLPGSDTRDSNSEK